VNTTYDAEAFAAAGLPGWAWRDDAIHARFATGDFATGLRLVDLTGAAAEEMDHHPDLDLRYPHVDVRLTSHDAGGVTDRDLRLARAIDGFAADLGVQGAPPPA
jgi:4a-hydroxytetrahydrobiopterin dehydratase